MLNTKPTCKFIMEPSLKPIAPGFVVSPNNGSFPRNIRPILPNVGSARKSELTDEQQFRLRWEQHVPNQQSMFSKLLEKGSFTDVALACEEKIINVHKLVLCSSSSYFESILSKFDRRDPIIILKDIRHDTMLSLVQFMYKGEVCLDQSRLAEVLDAAHALKIRGLSDELGDQSRPPVGEQSRGPSMLHPGVTTPNGASPTAPAAAPASSPYHSFKLAQSPSPRGGRVRRGRPKKEISAVPLADSPAPAEEGTAEKRRRLSNVADSHKEPRALPAAKEEKSPISPPGEVVKRSIPAPLAPRGPSLEAPALVPKPNRPVVVVKTVAVPKPATLDDIVPLDDYIKAGGSYARYWCEPWIALVMDAIKSKQLSLQDGANILGIKYQSLYGRYRVHHGYLITRKDEAASRRSRSDATDSGTDTNPDEWDPAMEPIVSIAEDREPEPPPPAAPAAAPGPSPAKSAGC